MVNLFYLEYHFKFKESIFVLCIIQCKYITYQQCIKDSVTVHFLSVSSPNFFLKQTVVVLTTFAIFFAGPCSLTGNKCNVVHELVVTQHIVGVDG